MKNTSACLRISACLILAVLFSHLSTLAQSASNDAQLQALSTWITLDAPPGWENLATDVVMKSMLGWTRDQSGNSVLKKGKGSPRRVVACAMDRPGFAVTEVTDRGYLRFREAGSRRMHLLWVQFHEGQRIRVLTRNGSVPGVVTVKSTHLQRRIANAPVTTLDDVWVDVGASSGPDVRRLGIQMLDPIVRDLPAWTYADYVAGPNAALRVGCAAVAQAARGEVTQGETVFLLTSLRSFGNDGLEAALRGLGKIDELSLVERTADGTDNPRSGVLSRRVEKPAFLPESSGITTVQMLSP